MAEDAKIVENSWTDPITGKFKPGNPGKPKGTKNKPKFLDEIEEMLDELAEGKDYTYRQALKKQILKKLIIDGDTGLIKEYWQQRDGKPMQPTDITSKGEKIVIPIFNGQSIQTNNSYQKDIPTEKENPSSVGGDISQQNN
jgi:hypothetical protein